MTHDKPSNGALSGKHILILVSEDWYFVSHRLSLAKTLVCEGARVSVVCRVKDHREVIENEGIEVLALPLAREKLSLGAALGSVNAIRNIYRRQKPDVIVQVALSMILLGSVAGLLARARKSVNILTGLGYAFVSDKWSARIFRMIVHVVFRLFSFSRRISFVVQNSDDFAFLQKLGFKRASSLTLIPGSGVDMEQFSPAVDQVEKPTVTFVGRMLWSKGIGELIEAARILKSKNLDFRLWFIGEPDLKNKQSVSLDELEAWQKEGLIDYLGRQSDISAYYQKSTIAVLPSWREGLPKSLLEAAACGLPLIASDVPGCRELVEDGYTGLLTEVKNPQSLAQAIEKLLKDADLCKKYGVNARKRVEEELNDRAISQKTARFIAS